MEGQRSVVYFPHDKFEKKKRLPGEKQILIKTIGKNEWEDRERQRQRKRQRMCVCMCKTYGLYQYLDICFFRIQSEYTQLENGDPFVTVPIPTVTEIKVSKLIGYL